MQEGHYHGLGAEALKNLPEYLENPDVILKTNESEKRCLVLSHINAKNGQGIISVEFESSKDYEGKYDYFNVIITVFDLHENYIKKLFRKNDAEIKYEKEDLVQVNPQLYKWLRIFNTKSSKDSIHNSDQNVKVNLSNMDSTGRELSEGQMEYFKDSAVRDENGSLKVMYRGDSSEFTVFDRKKTKYSNLYGRGFYFTDSKAHAEQYGGAREFYLDIKNPLSPKQNVITKKQMLNFLKAIEYDGEDYDLYNYGQDATAESVLNSVWGKGDFEMLQDINAGAIGDLVAAVELFNKVNGTSYDGIILPTETVTFKSEQAKLTSNLNPTENEDMRFSDRDSDYSYESFISKPDMKLTVLDGTVPNNRADIINQARKNAAKIGKINANDKTISVFVDDINRDIVIGTEGLKHGLRRLKNIQTDANSFVTLKAGEIIKNSILINELTPKRQNVDGSYVLVGAAKSLDDDLYIVQSVINQYSNELMTMDVLYAINTKKENRLRSMRPEILPSVTDSTISIADLLDYVNKYFPDILPEDVLKHYGYNARPDGELGESALYSDREDVSVYDLMGEADRLSKENENLRADVDRLNERLKIEKKVTHGNYFNENQLGAVAGHLRNISRSNMDKLELMKALKDVYSFIAHSENLTWEDVLSIRSQKDRAIIAKAALNDDMRREAQSKINVLANKYAELSKVSGLPTKMERMQVKGFRGVKVKPVDNSEKSGIINVLPNAEKAVIDKRKFTEYALNPLKDENKANAFKEALGYTLENVDELVDIIKQNINRFPAIEKPDNGYGKRYEILMTVKGANQKKANIKTAWIVDKITGETRLISAYVTKKKFKE